jgi:purine-binding chemotaxis protein CheW
MELTMHINDDKKTTEDKGTTQQFVTFSMADQLYGIDIMSVREIQVWAEATFLPNSPAYMRGVINLRGVVVPILDLRARFGMGITQASKSHIVIIVHMENTIKGILVDGVSDIINVPQSDIRPVPDTNAHGAELFFSGLINVGDNIVGLLMLLNIFNQEIKPFQSEGSNKRTDPGENTTVAS